MVAIVTGKGAGIENASVSLLGGSGQLGSAMLGGAGEAAYVNAATGNLVLTDMDEMLVGRGPDAAISRTYNSLGAWDGDNDDYWRAGVYRRVYGLIGGSGYGTAGSSVKRTDWDGSEVTYNWSTSASAYVSTDGAGAYDTLTRTSGVWTWTDGDTQISESYDDANSGRITARTDTSGNSVTYGYTNGLITRVTTSDGEYTDLVYGGAGGLQLQSLVTHSTFPTAQITRVYYHYDSSDRLDKVWVNLAPGDNSNGDTTEYYTSYTYDGSSQRIASITQKDGTSLAIAYTLVGSDYRVSAVTQQVSAGIARTTSFAYDTTNRVTTVTDPAGQVTRLSYDANGNLTRIVTPPAGAEMEPIVQEFAYEADGDVASVKLGPGNTITYGYDANGNRILERDSAGNTVTRTYGSKNQLLTETHYLTPDPDGSGSGTPSSPVVTNYVYDAQIRLRYVVTPEGRVTEYRYDGFGQQVSKIDYTAATYASTMTLGALDAWVGAMSDRSAAQRTDTWYDFRGNVARTESYAVLDVRGNGADSPLVITSDTDTSVEQQPDGLYRVAKTGGTNNWASDARSFVRAEGDFVLQMRANQTDKYAAAGVAISPGASSSDPNLDFGIKFNGTGNAYAYAVEGGTSTFLGATYGTTFSLWLVRTGSTYSYYKGATLSAAIAAGALRTSTGTTAAVYFNASVYSVGGSIDVAFTPQPIVNGNNTSVAQQQDGLYRITKTAGANVYDADGRGSVAANGDFVLQLRPGQSNADMVAGVSTAPGTSSSSSDIAFGFNFSDSGALQYNEGTYYSSLGGTYAAGESFWLTRVGSTVRYYRGATLEQAIAAGALRTVTGVSSTFYFDSALRVVGSKVDAAFTPGALSAPQVSRTDYVYDPSGRLLSRAAAGESVETYVYDGLGRVTSSTDMGGTATSVAFNDNANTTVATLANGVTRTSTYDRAGELVSVVEAGSGVATATTAYRYDSLGRLNSVTDPDGRSHFTLYDAVGRKTADVDADGSVTEYRYDANGNLTSTTAYATRLTASQMAQLAATPLTIGSATNVTTVVQADGTTRITKTAGGAAWNANAHSASAIDGDFVLEVHMPAAADFLVGISSSASSSWDGSIHEGLYFRSDNVFYRYVDGNSSYMTTGPVAYAANDTIWMMRTATTVNYYKGATLGAATAAGALRTVTGISGPVYLMTDNYNSGGMADVAFTPTPVIDSFRPAETADDRWNWNLYDAAQRLVETIDGTGSVTQLAYDGISQLVSTTQRANKVSGTALAAMKAAAINPNQWANPGTASSWTLYNLTQAAAGSIDGSNAFTMTVQTSGAGASFVPSVLSGHAGDAVTLTFWVKAGTVSTLSFGTIGSPSNWGEGIDTSSAVILSGPGTVSQSSGARWRLSGLSTTQATHVSVTRILSQDESLAAFIYPNNHTTAVTSGDSIIFAQPSIVVTSASAINVPATDAANDRVSRVFYDNDGRLVGALDAEGYLTQTFYDGAGRKIRTIAYSGATSTTYRASGTLAQLLGSITPSSANDIRNQWLYDARGLLRAAIDGEGTLTRYDYTPAGYLSQQVSGQKVDPATNWTLATLPSAGSAILETVAWTYNALGQKLTETRTLSGSTTTTTSFTYDSMHRLTATVTQSGVDPRTYSQRYDAFGRVTSELDAAGNAALAALGGSPSQSQIDTIYTNYGTTYAYDAAGLLASKTGPRGTASGAVAPRTVYYYTADGDLAYEIHGWTASVGQTYGEVTEYRYNAFGQRTDTIVYAGRVAPSTFSTLTGGLATSTIDTTIHALLATLDTATHSDYNVDGTLKQIVDPLSTVSAPIVTTYAYNAFGELITEVAPRDGTATIQSSRTYDRRGLLKTEIVDSASGGKAITTSYGYDAFGRALTLTNADSQVTTTTYDRKGRVATVKDALNNTTAYTYDARDNLVAVTDALGKVTRYVYDNADRRIAVIDALGGVTAYAYSPGGELKATTQYANLLSLTGLPLEVTLTSFIPPTANPAADRVTTYTYDRDGQLRFTIDGLHHVVEAVRDTRGNVIRTIAYDGAIASFTPSSVTTDWVASQVASLASAPGTRVTRAVYDDQDRVAYAIDAIGQVTFMLYDAKGLLVRQDEFAALYTGSGDPLKTDLDTWSAANASSTNDRRSYSFYDNKGQLAFTFDALGFVTRYAYDKLGNVKVQTRYADTYAGTLSFTALDAYYATTPTNPPRVTEFNYDSAGRLEETLVTVQVTPSVIKTSTRLVLDQMGRILSSTEAYGTAEASATSYAYDALGRVTLETQGVGKDEETATAYQYDALGRVTLRTVAYGTPQAVATKFEYDALGQLIKATVGYGAGEASASYSFYNTFGDRVAAVDGRNFLEVDSYDVDGKLLSEAEYGTALTSFTTATALSTLISAGGAAVTTTYSYDSFGDVVKVHDARGNDSFAYYDKLGRVTRQVDAEKYVTDTGYTRGSQVASVKRWAKALTVTVVETAVPANPTADAKDATTGFAYDKRDQLLSTTDAEGATESYANNAFGERSSVINKLGYATAYQYDLRGLLVGETLPVDTVNGSGTTIPVKNRYVYDLRGNLITKIEADGAAEVRTTTYGYDALDRLAVTTGDAVDSYQLSSDGLVKTNDAPQQKSYYDRRGNVVETIDAAGAHNWFLYDALDRKIGQVDALGALTRFTYDANGNMLTSTAYETPISSLPPTVWTVSGNSRLITYTYDRDNRLQSTTISGLHTGEYSGSVYTDSTADIVTHLYYDAAGNVVRQDDGRGSSSFTWFDRLGRAVAQVDAENYLTVWERDAEGNVLRETRYADQIASGESFTTATAVATLQGYADDDPTHDRITEFTYDRNGRRIQERRLNVAYTTVSATGAGTGYWGTSTIDYTYDGLDHVLTKTEANLADIAVSSSARETTTYQYDHIGRLVLETGQAFRGYLWTSGNPDTASRTAYSYDGLGNLKSMRLQAGASVSEDNDRLTTYTYDKGGRLLSMTEGDKLSGTANPEKFTHNYGYDKAGRTVLDGYTRATSTGSVTEAQVTLYDLAGRATVQTSARWNGSAWKFTTSNTSGIYFDAVRMGYDAFGEMTGRGITGGATGPAGTPVYQETFAYDSGGRLWKSNSGDGVTRFYGYDKAGNQTLALASTGTSDLSISSAAGYAAAIAATGDASTATFTIYDKRGQAKETHETARRLSSTVTAHIVHAKAYNAFGEVTAETGAYAYGASGSAITAVTTNFTYNTMGRMLTKVSPQVSITSETGVVSNANPTETYGYDLAGRLVSVTDANGHTTTRLLLAGTGHGGDDPLTVKEFHPDGGIFETRYDAFGDARILRNELYNGSNATATDQVQTFDKLGRLATVQHRGGLLTDNYTYDGLGQRIKHWNSQLGSSIKETSDYDSKGRVISTVAFGGDSMAYSYAWTTALTTSGLGDYDGWVKTSLNTSSVSTTGGTVTIASGIDSTESTDYFGRVIGRSDVAEVATTMAFDKGGRLVSQIIGGATATSYTWYNSGLQASVTTGSAVSTYTYDIAGTRHSEKYVVGGVTYQDATASWDALGRMTNFHDNGVQGGALVNIDYEYDAVGNVRHLKSVYTPLDVQGNSGITAGGQDYWYAYDSMNRFVINQGEMVVWGSNNHIAKDGSGNYIIGEAARGVSGAVIDRYLNGTELSWDKAGNRITATRSLAVDSYEGETGTYYIAFTEEKETYSYSADGYLAQTNIVQGPGTAYFNYQGDVYRHPNAATGSGVGRAVYGRDAMGRVTTYSEYNETGYVAGSPGSNLSYQRLAVYDAGGRVTQDTVISVRSDGTFKAVSDYYYAAALSSGLWSGVTTGGSYMGGAVTRVVTKNYKNNNDGDAPDTLTTNGYAWGQGGAVLQRVDYDKDTGDSGNTVWASTYTHDGAGLLTGAHIVDERERWVSLVNDAEGRVLQRDENDLLSTGDPKQLHYYFNGIRVGDISNNGTSNTDYAESIAAHVAVPGYGPFRGGTSGGMPYVDFDQSYDAINGLTYDATASSYTVQGGDTLQGIAHQLWGDASLWYLIADANGLGGSEALAAGRLLTIPNKVHNVHNNADTWRPYDPNEAQGDLSPTDAKKPKGNKCGTFGQILAAVVAVAVATLVRMIPIVGPYLAPYAANAAQQGVLIATGNQDKFDWKSFGKVAVDQFLPKTGNAFIDNAVTQKVSIRLGLQDKFSWAGVAAAGITAGVDALLNGTVGQFGEYGSPGILGAPASYGQAMLRTVVTNSATLIASSAATSLITGEDFGDTIMAALPTVIGQTIGQLAVGEIQGAFGWAKEQLGAVKVGFAEEEAKFALGNGKLGISLKAGLGAPKTTAELIAVKQNIAAPEAGQVLSPISARSAFRPEFLYPSPDGHGMAAYFESPPNWAANSPAQQDYGTGLTPASQGKALTSAADALARRQHNLAALDDNPEKYSDSAKYVDDDKLQVASWKLVESFDDMMQPGRQLLEMIRTQPMPNLAWEAQIGFSPLPGTEQQAQDNYEMRTFGHVVVKMPPLGKNNAGQFFRDYVYDPMLKPSVDLIGWHANNLFGSGSVIDTYYAEPTMHLIEAAADPGMGMAMMQSGFVPEEALGAVSFGAAKGLQGLEGGYSWLNRLVAAETTFTANVGRNTATFVLGADGAPISVSGNLQEYFTGATRGSAEVQAQAEVGALGNVGDHGGHLVDYRFILDQGKVNIFPQEGNFNLSAYKTLGNDYSRLIDKGYNVDFNHALGNFDAAGRPGSLSVTYRAVDQQGVMVDSWSGRFLNQPDQVYARRVH